MNRPMRYMPAGMESDEDDDDDMYSSILSKAASSTLIDNTYNSSNANNYTAQTNLGDESQAVLLTIEPNALDEELLLKDNSQQLQSETLATSVGLINLFNGVDTPKTVSVDGDVDDPIDNEECSNYNDYNNDVDNTEHQSSSSGSVISEDFNDLELFLSAINKDELLKFFTNENVTLAQVLTMNEQDLINCGINKVGDRKAILDATLQVHATSWEPTSLNDVTTGNVLSSPGIYILINDINKHIEYIGATLSYLSLQINNKPEILEIGKDFVGVGKIMSEIKDLTCTSKATIQDLLRLDNQLQQYINDPVYKSVDQIYNQYASQAHSPSDPTFAVIPSSLFSRSLRATSYLANKLCRASNKFKQIVQANLTFDNLVISGLLTFAAYKIKNNLLRTMNL